MPVSNFVAATSVGIVNDEIMADLNFIEDSAAQVDMNVVMDSSGKFIEIQASAEGYPFYREEFNKLLDFASDSIDKIIAYQKKVLSQGI
jgi:ribonuclease PH